MLFATTSNGVYCLDSECRTVRRVLGKKHTPGVFKPRSRGYFGITCHPATSSVLVASREVGNRLSSKLGSRVTLHLINPKTLQTSILASISDIHDVHQITWHDNYVLLTDTGKNRLIAFNPGNGKRLTANIGAQRKDVHHLNAVLICDGNLYLGLNNLALRPAVILHMPIREFLDTAATREIDFESVSSQITLGNAQYTHDLEPAPAGQLLACKSHDGIVFEVGSQRDWLALDGWIRGLAFSPAGLWVGNSEFADRKRRHDEHLDGSISLYEWPQARRKNHVVLHGAGQVNDLLYVEDP